MNGDVGLECCGSVCPATPQDAPASVGGGPGGATPHTDAPPKAPPVKIAIGGPDTAPATPPPCPATPTTPAPPQQNGEVTQDASGATADTGDSPAPSPTPPDGAKETQPSLSTPASETQGTQTTPSQTPIPGSPPGSPPAPGQMAPPPPPPQPLSREQIKQLVAQQVEYFFSRENLSSDPYLISQMDSDQYVPVYILANCTQFKTITKDHSIIVEALKESPFVQLDEESNRVRPNYKRCIVILREIPESTPIQEIESVFKSEECPKVVSCEFVHNSSWYVTFESDEDAQKAYWYLRGVVKTFKDKPILARIKTKPMSRLGCLSVLPSYGGKGGAGEAKEGQGTGTAPPSAQPSPGAVPGAGRGGGTPAPPAGTYGSASGGAGRFLYSTQQSVNPNSYTYTYSAPSNPMPTAYFYPNVMQWTPPPGGFYDINSFLQFNGLSPQGTFTPHNPGGPTLRYPPNRRNPKHREGNRYDKTDARHSGGGGQGNPPHYPRPHHHHHRPHPSPSPSQAPPHRPPSQAPSSGPTPPPPPPPPPPLPTTPGDNFAQSDLPLGSQEGLYTSFSPPTVHEKEVVTVKPPQGAASVAATPPERSSPPAAPQDVAGDVSVPPMGQIPPHLPQPPQLPQPPLPPHMHQPPHMHPRHHHHHHHHHHQFPPPHHLSPGLPGPPPPPPHRHGNYPPEHFHPHHHHPPHHLQQGPRPAFDDRHPYYHRPRNLRRRPRGREDEMMGAAGRGGPPQRGNGPPHQPTGGTEGGKAGSVGPQDVTPAPPPPPPQFDLEAASFPPLPSAEEQAVVVVERRSLEPLTSAWGGDTQRFSDVMKGNSKPRPPSLTDTPPDAPPTPSTPSTTPSTTDTASSTTTTATTVITATAPTTITATTTTTTTAATTTPQTSHTTTPATTTTTTTTTPPPTTTDDHTNHNHVPTTQPQPQVAPIAPTPTAPAPAVTTTPSPAPAPTPAPKPAPRDQRPAERRPTGAGPGGAANGPRERRDYREYPQRNQTGREFRGNRDPNLRTGKENRPVRPREDKMDADGWITKGGRESRAQRESREQWERGEGSTAPPSSRHHYHNTPHHHHHYHHHNHHHLVNGDSASSPPASPKPQKVEGKMAVEESKEPTKGTPARPLNNNDGEHKTTWAKMALASKDHMERLAAELKEKEEQEKIKKQRMATRPQPRPQEKVVLPRERDGKMVRREALPRDPRGVGGERGGPVPFRPRDTATPKSPK